MHTTMFLMLNYTSGKASGGVGTHNRTVRYNLLDFGTGAGAVERVSAAIAPVIPDTNYFMQFVGLHLYYVTVGTVQPAGITIQVERLAAEGGIMWESGMTDISQSDPEVGVRQCLCLCKATLFKRFPADADSNRIDIETARRYKLVMANTCTVMSHISMWMTYHAITWTVSGNVDGSAGGTVNIGLHKASDGELVATTSRAGNGAYSLTWYDNVDSMYTEARESDALVARS